MFDPVFSLGNTPKQKAMKLMKLKHLGIGILPPDSPISIVCSILDSGSKFVVNYSIIFPWAGPGRSCHSLQNMVHLCYMHM